MTPPKSISTILKFGKYSGRTIENIWTGKVANSKEVIIREYLRDFFHTFNGLSNSPKKVVSSDCDLEICKSEINYLQSNKVFLNIFAARKHLIICESDDGYLTAIRKVAKSFLSGSYNNLTKTGFQNADNLVFSKQSLDLISLFADPAYISWAILTINDFYFDPEDLMILEGNSSSRFSGFELTDICDDIIEYKPIFRQFNYIIPEEVKEKNLMKYDSWIREHEQDEDNYYNIDSRDYEKDNFDALTDGQYGDYEDWKDNDGDFDNLKNRFGF